MDGFLFNALIKKNTLNVCECVCGGAGEHNLFMDPFSSGLAAAPVFLQFEILSSSN